MVKLNAVNTTNAVTIACEVGYFPPGDPVIGREQLLEAQAALDQAVNALQSLDAAG